MKRIIVLALAGLLVSYQLPAQLNPTQNPPDLRWREIRTDYFNIIVPEELLAEGQRVANMMEYLRPSLEKTMYSRMRKWPLVLNSRSAAANGWVAYLPRMSQWYPVAPQTEFGGTLGWYRLLAVHEGRHMAQFDAFDRGFNRLAGIAFGELGLGAFTFFGTPLWFIEGDAVAVETALSNSGRGRQPVFDMGIRALLLSGRRCSYYKAYLGSYKDFFTDYYALGYHLVTHDRRKFGAGVWSAVMRRSARYSYWPWSFSRSMKKITGRNARGTYNETMAELQTLWTEQAEGLRETPVEIVNQKRKKAWTNYKFPHLFADGSIVALKSGLADPHTLVRLYQDGREKRIIQIDDTGGISVNAGKILWSVQNVDPRWWAQSFSDVVVYDIRSATRKEITEKGRYFAPALSPDGRRIAAVKMDTHRRCSLVLLDAETGREIRTFPNPENCFIKTPVWSEDGRQIGFTRQRNGLRALTVLEPETGSQTDIIPWSPEDITYPVFYGDYLLYDSPWSGIDNIYAVHLQTGRRYQLTSRKYGSFYPSPAGESLLFCDYQAEGMNIVRTALDTARWIPLEKVERRLVNYFEPLVEQEQGRNILNEEEIPEKRYPVRDYAPLKHSLNVHSWYLLPLPPYVIYGFLSNDYLNTLELGAQVTYHAGEQVNAYSLSASYAGIRPIIDTEISFGKRAAVYNYAGDDSTDVWNQVDVSGTVRLPVNNSIGPDQSVFEIGMTIGYSSVTDHEFMLKDDRQYQQIIYFAPYLNHSNHRRKAYRDIHTVHGYDLQASLSLGYAEFPNREARISGLYRRYLPGLMKHHGITGTVAVELHRDFDFNYFQSRIPFPRGYRQHYYELFKYSSLSYSLPLIYPDFAFGSLLYIKRLRAQLFWDFGMGDDAGALYRSAGVELMTDFKPLSLYYLEIGAGFRYTYRVEDNERVIEFILADIAF